MKVYWWENENKSNEQENQDEWRKEQGINTNKRNEWENDGKIKEMMMNMTRSEANWWESVES